jgi:hypothetical protein
MSVQAGTLPVNQQLFTQQNTPQQSPFAAQTPYQQGHFAQSPMSHAQTQIGAFGQVGQQMLTAAPVVSELTLRAVSAALATIIEQVRIDPQALQTLCAQGQLTPQTHANVLVESARRTAPVVAGALAAIVPGIGQQIPSAHGTQQYAQHPLINQQSGWQQPYGQQYGLAQQSPFGHFA